MLKRSPVILPEKSDTKRIIQNHDTGDPALFVKLQQHFSPLCHRRNGPKRLADSVRQQNHAGCRLRKVRKRTRRQ